MVWGPYRYIQGTSGRGLRDSEGNQECFKRTVYYHCRVTKVSANWRLLIPHQHFVCLILIFFQIKKLPARIYMARIAFQALISFYISEQAASGIWGRDMDFNNWYWQTRYLTKARVQIILKHVVVTVQVVLWSTAPPMICKKLLQWNLSQRSPRLVSHLA